MIKDILVTEEQYLARVEVCKTCDKFFQVIKMCGVCGCLMVIKARLESRHCPLYRWPGEVPPPQKTQ